MNQYLKQFIDLKFTKPAKALDLGAGDLADVSGLKELGWEAEGVDIKTGTDLEKPYISSDAPFDLVYSNYLLHKLTNKSQLIKTGFDNLKNGRWFFIHTFDHSDSNSKSDVTAESIETLLKKIGFTNISSHVFDFYDNDEGHKHWHKILEITAQKPS